VVATAAETFPGPAYGIRTISIPVVESHTVNDFPCPRCKLPPINILVCKADSFLSDDTVVTVAQEK
jgi:hypothetical protein